MKLCFIYLGNQMIRDTIKLMPYRNSGSPRDITRRHGFSDYSHNNQTGSSISSAGGRILGLEHREEVHLQKKEGESAYIKGGATHTKQGWGEPRETRQRPRSPQKYCSGGSQASRNLSFSPKVVSFNCKKPGHIRRDCQEKHSLRRVRSTNPHLPELKRQGSINGEPCSFHLDTGADITAIPQNFAKQSQYTGEVCNIHLGNLRHECMQVAEVMLEVEGKTRPCKVVVMEGTGREALLGVDHPVTPSLFGRGSFTVNGDDRIPEEGTYDRAGVLPFDKPTVEIVGLPSDNTIDVCAITRAMSQAQEAELAQHEATNAKDGAVSIPLSLPTSAATLNRRQRRSKFCQNPTILTSSSGIR